MDRLFGTIKVQRRVVRDQSGDSMFGTSKHILVVDDEEVLANAIASVLQAWGRKSVTQVNCVHLAEEVLQKKKVDLIITDVNMAVKSGYELVQYVFENAPDIPVILISGRVNIYDDYECSEDIFKHIYAFFEKPFDFEDLKVAVDAALQQAGQKKVA